MFGILRCPECNALQGCDLGFKTSSCRSCGKRVDLSNTSLTGPFKDQNEMRSCLWDMKSGKMTEEEVRLKEEILELAVKTRRGPMNRKQREELVLKLIEDGMDTEEKLSSSIREKDIEKEELLSVIGSLRKKELIYSPRYKVFKII